MSKTCPFFQSSFFKIQFLYFSSLLINHLTVKQPVRKKVPQLRKNAKKATKLATKKSMKCTKNALLDARWFLKTKYLKFEFLYCLSLVINHLTARQPVRKKVPQPKKNAKKATKLATKKSMKCTKNAPCLAKKLNSKKIQK